MSTFWHPFADMGTVDGHEMVIDRGEGIYVFDEDGRRYLDATASLWYCNVGYGRQEIVAAVVAQMEKLHAYHTFGDFVTRPVTELTEKIASVAPVPGSKVFLTSGGSDSVDSAAKLARRYFHLTGQPERTMFIAREWGYHGTHAYGTSLAGMAPNKDGYGDLVGDVVTVPWDSVEAVEKVIEQAGPERIAGLFCEPVIGAGGVRVPPDGYLTGVREAIRRAGALFIADEVVTGFGRIGAWFASTRFDLEPDLVTFAKGVTSGYLPLGGVIAAPWIAEPFWEGGVMWRHGYTYSGHTTGAAAALANLEVVEREGLLAHALQLESELANALAPLGRHPLVTEIRSGLGVLGAVQLDPDAIEADPGLPVKAFRAIREAGALTRPVGGGGLQISPPLIITPEQVKEMVAAFTVGLDTVEV
ncbi:MAG: aspartate aminotransferase family protein [Acidimicrobiia bacterium]|nr:aspartate aminotransferase family protein [Acidimicrobiia bacterium]